VQLDVRVPFAVYLWIK